MTEKTDKDAEAAEKAAAAKARKDAEAAPLTDDEQREYDSLVLKQQAFDRKPWDPARKLTASEGDRLMKLRRRLDARAAHAEG